MITYEIIDNIGDNYLVKHSDNFYGKPMIYYRFVRKESSMGGTRNIMVISRQKYTMFYERYFKKFVKQSISKRNRFISYDPDLKEAINIFDRKAKLKKLLS